MNPKHLIVFAVIAMLGAVAVVWVVSLWPDEPAPPPHLVAQQLLIASWFDVPPDAVEHERAGGPGDTEVWKVEVPHSGTVTVATKMAMPVYFGSFAVPDEAQIEQRWQGQATFTAPLSRPEREVAEMAAATVGMILSLPALTEEYLEVVEVYALGDDPEAARVHVVVLRLKQEPWRQLSMVSMGVVRETRRVQAINPEARIYVWSDMFDPFHNAGECDYYYLVNGNWVGSWEGLDPEIIIANWYSRPREQNLPWFAERGHKQLLVSYYDRRDFVTHIQQWIAAAHRLGAPLTGAMYATWRDAFDDLERWAEAAWGAADGQ